MAQCSIRWKNDTNQGTLCHVPGGICGCLPSVDATQLMNAAGAAPERNGTTLEQDDQWIEEFTAQFMKCCKEQANSHDVMGYDRHNLRAPMPDTKPKAPVEKLFLTCKANHPKNTVNVVPTTRDVDIVLTGWKPSSTYNYLWGYDAPSLDPGVTATKGRSGHYRIF